MRTALARIIVGCVLLAAGGKPGLTQEQKNEGHGAFTTLGKPVARAALDGERGGKKTTVINSMEVGAKVFDNRAINTVNGSNSISDSAFSQASGFSTAIQNTGNNCSIQYSTILNMQMQ